MEGAVHNLLLFSMIFLGITISFCLLRGILGPRFTDRVVAVNVIGVKTILMIAALSVFLKKPYLLDICLIYSIISFLTVVVVNNTYLLIYNRKVDNQTAFAGSTEEGDSGELISQPGQQGGTND